VPNETLDFDGPAGRLEALLMVPDQEPVAAAVVCHANPLEGGVMHFKVVFRAAKALRDRGLAALRFNFRGVGRSEGTHDLGRGEQDDARAALGVLEQRFPSRPLVLGGFSFGAGVALRASLAEPRVGAAFALGYPLSRLGGLSFLAERRLPRLFVQGEHDAFGGGPQIQAAIAEVPAPRRAIVIAGADHFFTGQLDALEEAVGAWAAERPWEAA
jgi:alpha/beta superfamily hydrolase